MSEDHLKGEVSVSVELTPTGVKAGAKSRFISAIDLLFGNAVDLLNPKLEGIKLRERARIAQDVKLIEALGERRVQMLDQDPSYAEQVLEQQLRTSERRLENKAETVRLAIEDLRATPPTEEQNETGPEALDPDFLNRFERYAEDATTQQLRERWGRVLAAEIRTPGTFSAKVMRIVDEMDSVTARMFEQLCLHRLQNAIIACLAGELPFMETARLVGAGLIVDPTPNGQLIKTTTLLDTRGDELNFFSLKNRGIGIAAKAVLFGVATVGISRSLILHDRKPAVPVYVLTDEGHAISSILPSDEDGVFDRFLARAVADHPKIEIREFQGEGGTMQLINTWNRQANDRS